MELNEECKGCLYASQLTKVEKDQADKDKFERFKAGVKKLCDNPPPEYCAPLLMRDIDNFHREIFGEGIDYSREKSMFNLALLKMEEELYSSLISLPDPLEGALKFATASNYIDFARLCGLNEESIQTVFEAARRAEIAPAALELLKLRLTKTESLCILHDNCGEIVLDKILIRVIKNLYPQISVTSVVRGEPIINDVTLYDAQEVGLDKIATVVANGSGVPGTYIMEVSPEVLCLLKNSGVVISKGLGNLETLFGAGYDIFYAFNCKCTHISERFNLPLWSAAFIYGGK